MTEHLKKLYSSTLFEIPVEVTCRKWYDFLLFWKKRDRVFMTIEEMQKMLNEHYSQHLEETRSRSK